MYMVVSYWEPLPGKKVELERIGRKMRNVLAATPGVQLMESFWNDESGQAVVVAGYTSKAEYDRIINDPNGPFAKAEQEHGIDSVGRWMRSERGESMDR